MGVLRTPWKVVTTEESSGSLILTIAFGKIYLEHEKTGEKMTIKYNCVSVGAGKGPPVGANWSNTSDPSGALDDNVVVTEGYSFSDLKFPGAAPSPTVSGPLLRESRSASLHRRDPTDRVRG